MTEQATYELLEKDRNRELRKYPQMLLASVHGLPEDDAFRKLFSYMSGENNDIDRMKMTVPLLIKARRGSNDQNQDPVVEKGVVVSFILPTKYEMDYVPRPKDTNVTIESVPPRKFLVLSFRGSASVREVNEKKEELMDWVVRKGLKINGRPVEMYYNGPWTPGTLRHYEVAVEILDSDGPSRNIVRN